MQQLNTQHIHDDAVMTINAVDRGDKAYDGSKVEEVRLDSSHYDDLIQDEIRQIDLQVKASDQRSFTRDDFQLDPKLNFDPNVKICRDDDLDFKVKEELRYNQNLYNELKEKALQNRQNSMNTGNLLSFLSGNKSTLETAFNREKKDKYIKTLVTNTNKSRKAEQILSDAFAVAKKHYIGYQRQLQLGDLSAPLSERLLNEPDLARAAKMHAAATKEWMKVLSDVQTDVLSNGTLDVSETHNAAALEDVLNRTLASVGPDGSFTSDINKDVTELFKSFGQIAPAVDKKHVGNLFDSTTPEQRKENQKAMDEFIESIQELFNNLKNFLGSSSASSSTSLAMKP